MLIQFNTGTIDDLANALFTQASNFYREKGNRISTAALPVFKQVVEDPKNSYDKILVPITPKMVQYIKSER